MIHPLYKVIKKEDFTYEELGNLIGISRQGVYNILKGYAKPSMEVMLKILMLFPKTLKPIDFYVYYFRNDKDKAINVDWEKLEDII